MNLYLKTKTISKIDQLTETAQSNGHPKIKRGHIIDAMVEKLSDPISDAREQMKYHQKELMYWKDRLDQLEEMGEEFNGKKTKQRSERDIESDGGGNSE